MLTRKTFTAALLPALISACQPFGVPKKAPEALVDHVLLTTPLIDGHNDLIARFVDCPTCPREFTEYDIGGVVEGRTDIPRWRQGRLGAQLLNAGWVSGEDRSLIGVDYVGIGSDFDGDPSVVVGLEDVSRYSNLLLELATRGWSESDLRKVAGENFLRVLERAEHVAVHP